MAEGAEQDQSSKTEEPTSKRLQEAREKGQVATSREISNAAMIGAGTIAVLALGSDAAGRLMLSMRAFIERPHVFAMDEAGIADVLGTAASEMAMAALPILGLLLLAALAANFLQHGWLFTAESVKPKWSKISPVSGFKRIFSVRGAVEMAKGIAKIAIVGAVACLAVVPMLGGVEQWVGLDAETMMATASDLTVRLLLGVVAAVFVIAGADYGYQWWNHHKQLRMTKQEVRDEGKQQEGDPHVKGKIRALRAERARKRMMQAVPEADVVVTNPTAVALKYDAERMSAPRLVAKGVDQVAMRIRAVADEHEVPIVENPPLARALYAGVELDHEIPEEHYRAVAQVISYVMKLKGRVLPAAE
ncbi:MAG: flagellar biosynthesis protein FlhB [Alphaproteobacteria bacterium]|nr:flagellar biosynthesis protein FlhB [Alphaproteobacteria bacterium]